MPIFATNVSTTEFTPHPKNDDNRYELVHYLRRSTGSWTTLRAGMVIAEPQEGIIGDGMGDDTVFVYEGVAEVRTVEGQEMVLRAGDYVSFPRGISTTWNIKEKFRGIFCYLE